MLFTRHNDSVLCCSVDNSNRLAVSGGIDDTAFVWDLKTQHVIFECLGHKESVVAAAFSANSTYVATGDLNGYIQVRNTTTGMKVFDYETDEINWILWHNNSEFVLLAGTTKGDFWMWNVNDPAAVKTFPSFGFSTTGAKLMPDGMQIVVTYQDGAVRIFDLKTKQAVLQLNDPNHVEIISMDLNPTKALIAIGCIDSTVKLITAGNCKLIGTMSCKTVSSANAQTSSTSLGESLMATGGEENDSNVNNEDEGENHPASAEDVEIVDETLGAAAGASEQNPNTIQPTEEDDEESDEDEEFEQQNDAESVESVNFSPCGKFLAAANNSGSIYVWDVSSQVTRCEIHTGIGITRCTWTVEGHFITACLDGCLRIYDINLVKLHEIVAHKDQILDISHRDRTLVTASEDKTCRVTTMN